MLGTFGAVGPVKATQSQAENGVAVLRTRWPSIAGCRGASESGPLSQLESTSDHCAVPSTSHPLIYLRFYSATRPVASQLASSLGMSDEPTNQPTSPLRTSTDVCDSHTSLDPHPVVSCFYGSWRHTGLGPTLVHRQTDPPLLFPSEQLEPPAEDMKDCLETAVRFAQRLILGPALDTVTSLLAPPADHPAVRRALKEEVAGLKLRLFVDWRLPMQVFGFHPPAGGEYGAMFEDVLFINQWVSVSVGLL